MYSFLKGPVAYHDERVRSSVRRVGSSSRQVASHSNVDFDQIPAPRPSSAHSRRRRSIANGRTCPRHQYRGGLSGLRCGHCLRYKPLEWWRLEKVVYGRRNSGTCLVPSIQEIYRVEHDDAITLCYSHFTFHWFCRAFCAVEVASYRFVRQDGPMMFKSCEWPDR